jgi:hypothetical protein
VQVVKKCTKIADDLAYDYPPDSLRISVVFAARAPRLVQRLPCRNIPRCPFVTVAAKRVVKDKAYRK